MALRVRSTILMLALAASLPALAWKLPWQLRAPVTPRPEKFAERITASNALVTVESLASPEYAGRLTGTGGFPSLLAFPL